jgi:NTE family protein
MDEHKSIKRNPSGIALAGGGPLGGIYEVGALVALDEALCGLRLNDCDVFVGVSSGAFFASGLANGLSPREMHARFIETAAHDDPFAPEVLLKMALREYGKRIALLPKLFASALSDYLWGDSQQRAIESFQRLSKALPNGIFDSGPIRRYLQRLAATPGLTDDFRELKRKLFIVAADLDTSSLVTFGAPGFDHVPISKAVDGRHYVDGALLKTLHASAALTEGVKLLFAINPLVPYKAEPQLLDAETQSVAEDGLVTVLSQTFRSLIYSRMKVGMERYGHQYPDADIVLFEPRRDDPEMFFTNVFSYAERRRLCEHAYQQTREDLLRRAASLKPVLARHGLSLNEALLRDKSRTLMPRDEEAPRLQTILKNLSETLGRLEPVLHATQKSA